MTTFDDRKDAYENKFARDKEADFKITARRNKLLGYWAADKLHLTDADRDAYAKEVVLADFDEPGDEDVLRKVQADFEKAGLTIDKQEIRAEMHHLLSVAREQLAKE